MATDTQIEAAWHHSSHEHGVNGVIPQWGDATCWADLRHTTPYTKP